LAAAVGPSTRVVINYVQARSLLAAVKGHTPALNAYFACMYCAALRPAEVSNLRERDLHLPESGWGQITVDHSYQVTGAAWTDSGAAGEERELKHRAVGETRRVPPSAQLVATLREHLDEFGTGAEGRLFITRTARSADRLRSHLCRPSARGRRGASGRLREGPRSPKISRSRRSLGAPMTCAMHASRRGSRPGSHRPRLPGGQATASRSRCGSTRIVSMVKRRLRSGRSRPPWPTGSDRWPANSPQTPVDHRIWPDTAGHNRTALDLRFRWSRAVCARGGR